MLAFISIIFFIYIYRGKRQNDEKNEKNPEKYQFSIIVLN